MDDRNEDVLETPGDDANGEVGESAEDQVIRLGKELEQARREVTEIQTRYAGLERGRAIDAALMEQGTVDMETARLVVESMLKQDREKEVGEVVASVRERKPFLFLPPVAASGVMSAQGGGAGRAVERAEREARESGHRRDVLRFMRLRRCRK